MVKRYPHTFSYYGKSGTYSGGEYIPGSENEPTPFGGRIVFKPELVKNADGSMSQVEGKIHCKPLDVALSKGDEIQFGERSLTVFSSRQNQLAWVIWVV